MNSRARKVQLVALYKARPPGPMYWLRQGPPLIQQEDAEGRVITSRVDFSANRRAITSEEAKAMQTGEIGYISRVTFLGDHDEQ